MLCPQICCWTIALPCWMTSAEASGFPCLMWLPLIGWAAWDQATVIPEQVAVRTGASALTLL